MAGEGTSRFSSVSRESLDQLKRDAVPENTKNKQRWAMKLFCGWRKEMLTRGEGTVELLDLTAKPLENISSSELNFLLQYFIPSARKEGGEKYPPRTLKEIIALIQHYFNMDLNRQISIFCDGEFAETRLILDATMKKLAEEGLVKPKKRANVITVGHEAGLWKNNVLGVNNPQQLLDSLIFSLGLHLGLRACAEHRALEFGENSQLALQWKDGEECIIYTERVSKNKKFGLKQSRLEPKCVTIRPNPFNQSRCVVELYKKYILHR